MINYILKGHTLGHEVQTIVQVFYPNLHYYETDKITEEGITVVSFFDETTSSSQIYSDGKCLAEKSFFHAITNISAREKKRLIKMAIYECLKEITGYEPKWGMITGIRPAKTVTELIELGESEEEALSFLTEKYFVTDKKAKLALEVAKAEKKILNQNNNYDYSLYIGIPFCPTRCLYCSFTSYPIDKYKKLVDVYLDKLIEEMEFVSQNTKELKPMSIYIGGGTPTSINAEQLKRLLEAVAKNYDTRAVLEYTVEAGRPDTITKEKLEIMKDSGVDRISINPQTMNQKTLDIVGRRHTVGDVETVFNMARETGFTNINMDLILGLPEEATDDVKNTINRIKLLNPDSITVHTLAVKRASRLKETFEDYTLTELSIMEEMIETADEGARSLGMEPYYMYRQKNMIGNLENVGYCKTGKESVYNIEIMEEKQTIIAIGAGSTTKVYNRETNQLSRIFNVKSVEDYLNRFDEMIERKKAGLLGGQTLN